MRDLRHGLLLLGLVCGLNSCIVVGGGDASKDALPTTDSGTDTVTSPTTPMAVRVEGEMTVGVEGGTLSLTLPGWIETVELTLPPDVVDPGEEAVLTLVWEEDLEPQFAGVDPLGTVELQVVPTALRDKVEEALEASLRFDASVMGEAGAAMQADPVAWALERLLVTEDLDDSISDATLCVWNKPPELKTSLWPIGRDGEVTPSFTPNAEFVWLHLRWTDFWATQLGPRTSGDGPLTWYHSAAASETWPSEHPHIGRLRYTAFPVSVVNQTPRFSWPTNPADADTVRTCIQEVTHKVLDVYQTRFPSLVADAFGDEPLEWNVFIYDFTATPTTLAQANYGQRWLRVPSTWLDPDVWKEGCFSEKSRPFVSAAAHEIFHWQSEVYLMNLNDPDRFTWGRDAYWRKEQRGTVGPLDVTPALGFRPSHWWAEAMANLAGFEVSGELPWAFYGLYAYPLSESPWMEWGQLALAPATNWDYRKSHFMKYLTDREDAGTTDELAELASLLSALQADHDAARAAGAPAAEVDYNAAIWRWAEARDRGYFDFFREMALLRGCASDWSCPEIPHQLATRPFGTLSQGFTPVVPGAAADRWWSPYLLDPTDPHASYPEPFADGPLPNPTAGKVVDLGASWVNTTRCRFDSVLEAYTHGDLAGAGLLALDQPFRHPLSDNLRFPQTGTRVDFIDDLPYDVDRYLWRIKPALGCPDDLRLELYQRTDQAESLSWGGVLEDGEVAMFTEALPAGASAREVTLLAGRTGYTGTTTEATCEVTVEVLPDACPCDSMPILEDDGGPTDLVLHCGFDGGGTLAYCNNGGFWASGLIQPKEYPTCYHTFPEIGEFCGLAPNALD